MPVYSMTGFGKGQASLQGRALTAEIKSVNNRFLELQMKGYPPLMPYDHLFLKAIKEQVERGTITLYLNIDGPENSRVTPALNLPLARQYGKLLQKAARSLGLKSDFQASFILNLPEVIKVYSHSAADEALLKAALEAVSRALRSFNEMRRREGGFMARELTARCRTIEKLTGLAERLAPERLSAYRQRLQERLAEAVQGPADEILRTRVAAEVSVMADKLDVSEEIVRLKSHALQFRRAIEKGGAVGKKLNFLLQEINRELNTLSAKANHAGIAQHCVVAKEEAEKMRELVQNLE